MPNLRGRISRLEQKVGRVDPFRGTHEVRFALFSEELPVGVIVPEGAHIVADFCEEGAAENWGGRPGVAFHYGYYRQGVSHEPTDCVG
jgi:hypothetical protein